MSKIMVFQMISILIWSLVLCYNSVCSDEKTTLRVSFLSSINGPSKLFAGAFFVSLEYISKNTSLLEGYQLDYIFSDTSGNSLNAINAMTEHHRKETIGFIGPDMSCLCESTVASAWNLPMVAYVLVGLRFLAKGSFYSEVADLHGISRSSVCVVLESFVEAVNDRLDNIRFPFDSVNTIKHGFYRRCGLPNVIGAVDGTLIPIQAPSENEAAFVCRKGYHAINMQGIVDSNMRFMDIVAKWPGSQHDSFIFNNSGIKSVLERRDIGHLLGDSGYPLRSYLVTPVFNPASSAEISFNQHHGCGRSVIEKAFGVLKSRFRCLHKSGGCLLVKPTKSCKVAEACVRLHNFCLDRRVPLNEQDHVTDDDDNVGNFASQMLPSRGGCDRRQSLINLFNS